ncbi:hypothetical protein ACSBR2_019429 [Camellia fascicularis]
MPLQNFNNYRIATIETLSLPYPAPLLTLLFSFPLLATLKTILHSSRSNSSTSPRSADRTSSVLVSVDLHQKGFDPNRQWRVWALI